MGDGHPLLERLTPPIPEIAAEYWIILGLSQPTIARRLAAFEASFGGPALFDRLPEGLRLTAAGEQLISAAEGIEVC